MEDQEFEDFDLNRLAEEILLQKTWADMDFDDFWAWLRVTTRAQTLVALMHSDPDFRRISKKCYEDMSLTWLEDVNMSRDELENSAWRNFIRVSMTYSFALG